MADISRAEVTRKTYLQTDREKAIITLHAHACSSIGKLAAGFRLSYESTVSLFL